MRIRGAAPPQMSRVAASPWPRGNYVRLFPAAGIADAGQRRIQVAMLFFRLQLAQEQETISVCVCGVGAYHGRAYGERGSTGFLRGEAGELAGFFRSLSRRHGAR